MLKISPNQTESSSPKEFFKTKLKFLTEHGIKLNYNPNKNKKLMHACTWQIKTKLEKALCKWLLEVLDLEAVMIKNLKIKKINQFFRAIHIMMHIHQTCET